MRSDIVRWCAEMCEMYQMTCVYLTDRDVYSFTKKGRGIQGFNQTQFYGIPKRKRVEMLRGIIMRGLNHNMGEVKLRESGQLNIPWKLGKLIAKCG